MLTLPDWSAPGKPVEITYDRLVRAILDGTFPSDSSLPAERQLAERLGVTRSTLREALQRLATEGWIEIQQGRPTRIRDIWVEGNLTLLAALVQHQTILPHSFIPQLLEVRCALAPFYGAEAVKHNPVSVQQTIEYLLAQLDGSAASFAEIDWRLHHQLTVLSTNPIYTLILNGFAGFYQQMARLYFSLEVSRHSSRQFYIDLLAASQNRDADRARQLIAAVTQHSIELWQQIDV